MTDANLVRVLGRQARGPVGLVPLESVRRGTAAVAERFDTLKSEHVRLAIVDAVEDDDLRVVGRACTDLTLVTGGSGIAIGLPENFRRAGLLGPASKADALPAVGGASAVLSGSCSPATREQVRVAAKAMPSFRIDPVSLANGEDQVAAAIAWAKPKLADGPVLIYATAEPEPVRAAQERLGAARAGNLVEAAIAAIARGLIESGVRRLVVAGGETSGAVIGGLGVEGLRIGREIDPGVPWTVTLGEPPLALALKSGNFGSPDFFLKAFEALS